jgi:hypothetical protein
LKIHFNVECAMIRVKISPLFEFARVLVRFDHIARLRESRYRVNGWKPGETTAATIGMEDLTGRVG